MKNFRLPDSIGFLINVTASRFKNDLARGFAENGHDITADQWAVMISLWKNEGRLQNEIAGELVKDKTNITRILDIMEKKELIKRQPHESDRRSYRIYLTDKSRMLLPELIRIAVKTNDRYTSVLTQEEIACFKDMLKRLYAAK